MDVVGLAPWIAPKVKDWRLVGLKLIQSATVIHAAPEVSLSDCCKKSVSMVSVVKLSLWCFIKFSLTSPITSLA